MIMAKPIELETVFTGKSAVAFNKYLKQPSQQFSPQSRTLINEARRLAKESPK